MLILLLAALLALPTLAHAQSYETMRMIRPIATGAAGTGLHASNRIYRAYTGIPYEIHADAVGGKWPYTYSLSNAPAGMTIEAGPCVDIGPTGCTAGTITWPNPTSTASNITVTVTDSLGTQVSGTWTITVGTSGFCFIDAVSGNDTTGSGTLASPWQTLDKGRTTCGAASVMYLRAGTYHTAGMAGSSAGEWWKVSLNETSHPVIWLAYPGETVTIDPECTGSNACEYFNTDSSDNFWIDSIRFDNVGCNMFRVTRSGRFGAVFRKNTWVELVDAESEFNCGYVMLKNQYASDATYPTNGPSFWDTFQNETYGYTHGDGTGTDDGAQLKMYSTEYMLIEHNRFSTIALTEAALATKTENYKMTIRGNIFDSDVTTGFGGNLHATVIGGVTEYVCTVDHTTDVINKTSHGFANDTEVVFQFTTNPTGLTKETTYYVINQTANTFQVSTTLGGAAATFSTNGLDCWVSLRSRMFRTGGELYHNLFLGGGTAANTGAITIGVSRTWEIDPIQVYRNTIVGSQVNMANLTSIDGPFNFYSNVIVNGGGSLGSCPERLDCNSVSDYSTIVVDANNLQGANDGTIANATTGALVNRSNVGTYGYELSNLIRRFAPLLHLRR